MPEDKKKKKKKKSGVIPPEEAPAHYFYRPEGREVAPLETNIPQARLTPEQEERRAIEEEQEARKEEVKPILEEKGFFEETRPERVELEGVERKGFQKVPVAGPMYKAQRSVLTYGIRKGWFPDLWKQISDEEIGEFQMTLIQDPETLREAALQEIQKEVISEGLSRSENIGALIESIPIVGGLVGKYAGGMIETPSENVNTIVETIGKMGTRATNMREKAATGKMGDPLVAYEQIEQIQNDIARLEQRIKLLSLQSAELIADADALNKIEEAILDAKQRAFDAKQAAAAGMIAPATDASIYFTLKELKERKS